MQDSSGEITTSTYNGQGQIATMNGEFLHEVISNWDKETGQLKSITDPTGTTTYHYDSETGAFSGIDYPNNSSIRYQRDILGRVEKVIVKPDKDGSAEYITKYEYDANGNIEKVTDPNNKATILIYDKVNRLEERILPNGIKTVYTYKENTDFIEKITHLAPDGVTVISSVEYERSDSGEPTKITHEDGSYVKLKYDESLRLEKETYYDVNGVEEEISYSYDEAGNRQTVSSGEAQGDYDYENLHQLTQIDTSEGVETYHYDEGGRLETITRDGESWELEYNADDLIIEVKKDGEIVVQYVYDTSGRRVEMSDGEGERDYLVAPLLGDGLESPHLVMDELANPMAAYVYAGSMPLMRLDEEGNPVYYLEDGMGSIVGLADNNGVEVAQFEYDSFGNLRGDSLIAEELGGDFRFQGQWLESNTDLYHFRARYYDPETGRFVSRDPVDVIEYEPESSNPYQFVYNNPHVYSDPTGLFTITELNAAQNLQTALSSIRRYAGTQAKDYIVERLGETFGNIAMSIFNNFLPHTGLTRSYIDGALDQSNDFLTDLFELDMQDFFCEYFEGLPLANTLHFYPRIQRNGELRGPGLNCNNRNEREDPRIANS